MRSILPIYVSKAFGISFFDVIIFLFNRRVLSYPHAHQKKIKIKNSQMLSTTAKLDMPSM